MKQDIDNLLREALAPMEEPGDVLNEKILQYDRKKGRQSMQIRRLKIAVLGAVCVLVVGSATAYAAMHYLEPEEVAEDLGYQLQENLLRNQDTEIQVQEFDDYKVAMLGIFSGEELDTYMDNMEYVKDRIYSVVAIERTDGMAITEADWEKMDFFVSPYVSGYNPVEYNIATMGGGYGEYLQDGILYRISECDDVAVFADHTLYLGVSDTTFHSAEAFTYHSDTGEITRNMEYEGVNALFILPIDPAYADQSAAEALIEKISASGEEDCDIEITAVDLWVKNLTEENINEYCVLLENTVQTAFPDEEGWITFPGYQLDDEIGGGSDGCEGYVEYFLEDDETFRIHGYGYGDEELETLTIQICQRNADGSITLAVYVPKDISIYLK